jgi:hypothetical protein
MGFMPILEGATHDLDLNTVELFGRFFSIEEMLDDLYILTLSTRELTLLTAVLLQEVAKQISQHPALRDAVRTRVRSVASMFPDESAQ